MNFLRGSCTAHKLIVVRKGRGNQSPTPNLERRERGGNLGERFDDGVEDVARLSLVVLLDGADPPRVVVRVRRDEDLELLGVPLVALVVDLPPLLPRAAVNVEELNPVVEVPGGDVDGRLAADPRGYGGRGSLRDCRVAPERRPAGEAHGGAGVRGTRGGAGGGETEAEEREEEERHEDGRGEGEHAAGVWGGGGGVVGPAAAGGEGGLGAEVVVPLRLGGGGQERAGAGPAAGEEGHRCRRGGLGTKWPGLTDHARSFPSGYAFLARVPSRPGDILSASFDSQVSLALIYLTDLWGRWGRPGKLVEWNDGGVPSLTSNV
jgi:hypothetical protein